MALDYPYIRAWGKYMWSYPYTIEQALEQARKDKAPANAVYYSPQNKCWVIIEDVCFESVRLSIKAIAEKIHE